MTITVRDLESLRQGEPPADNELLVDMTVESETWLDGFAEHYLSNYVANGGSKVKVLIGSAGVGKSHLLRCVESRASKLGYIAVYFSARDWDNRLNDLPDLYRTISSKLDHEQLVRGLCLSVAANLGYGQNDYSGDTQLVPLVIEDGLNRNDAEREIRNAIGRTFRDVDFGSSFATFAYTVARNRMITGLEEGIHIALKWLCGQKLDRHERQATGLFETLQKVNARAWLNSLIRLLNIVGMTGLVVLIDDLETLTERSPLNGRYLYSAMAIKDTYELLRQLIDDVEMLSGFMMLAAGRRVIVEDEKRGFKSYEALWMRLQTGLVPSEHFNPYADIVDVDAHLEALGPEFAQKLSTQLRQVLQAWGCRRIVGDEIPDLTEQTPLRAAVMENAWLAERTV